MPLLTLKPKFNVALAIVGKQHFYDVSFTGEPEETFARFPGVTGFLDSLPKPWLVNWAKKEALNTVRTALLRRVELNVDRKVDITEDWIERLLKEASARPAKIKDDAADLGTRIHAHIDLIIHGKEPQTMEDDIQPAITAFKDWWKGSGIELVLGDTKVASLVHKYGGSLDALGRRNGDFIILDWKSSNFFSESFALQVAAYARAFEESYGINVQEAIIVRFNKKLPVEFEFKKVRDIEKSFQAFLKAKELKEHLEFDHFDRESRI